MNPFLNSQSFTLNYHRMLLREDVLLHLYTQLSRGGWGGSSKPLLWEQNRSRVVDVVQRVLATL
jgi:hypothetical protein